MDEIKACKGCGSVLGDIEVCKQKYCSFEICSVCQCGGECEDCARQTSLEKEMDVYEAGEEG